MVSLFTLDYNYVMCMYQACPHKFEFENVSCPLSDVAGYSDNIQPLCRLK